MHGRKKRVMIDMFRAYKTELAQNNKQRTAFLQHAGASRFVYNWALADRIERYERGEKTTYYEQRSRFTTLKDEHFPWLRQTAYCIIDSAFANLDMAYKNFFRRIKQGSKAKGFPNFKSKHGSRKTFTMRGCLHVTDSHIKLPRIGWVRLKERGYLPIDRTCKFLSATISERAGRWYVSLQIDDGQEPPMARATGKTIGVDLGVKTLAVCSNGKAFTLPETQKENRKLKRLEREKARRKKGSRNRARTIRKIQRCCARIANIRKHTIHNMTTSLTVKAKPWAIVMEDLNVAGMVKNHNLARVISNASFAEVRGQMEYKALWQGTRLYYADRFYPSTKTCSVCGFVKDKMLLSERTFVCEQCGLIIDRDLNAAQNLAALHEPPNGRGLPVELTCSNASPRSRNRASNKPRTELARVCPICV